MQIIFNVKFPTLCEHHVYSEEGDMTSRRSENLDALITFQGQESQMQVTRMALWTVSSHEINSQ